MRDLRARLIGSTVEQFLARPDVEFIDIVEGGYLPVDFDEDEYEDDEDYQDDGEEGGVPGGEFEFRRPALEDAEVISATDGPVGNASPPQPTRHTAGGSTAEPEPTSAGTPEEAFQRFARLTRNLVAAVKAWCFNEGIVPATRLEKAAAFSLASGAMIREYGGGDAEAEMVMDHLMETVPDEEVDDVEAGVQQVRRFIRSYPSAAAFRAAIESIGRRLDEEEKQRSGAAPAPSGSAERQTDALPEPQAADAAGAQQG
jgi:hypothetical protein